MSLTSILKEIDRVNKKHRQVERRYNRKNKGCPRQQDMEQEQLEDKHIFGYSHSQILHMFKKNSADNEQTRPSTAILSRPMTPGEHGVYLKKEPPIRRAQSATKVTSYKQQYNFLFKEDIFDENHQKIRYTLPFKDQNFTQNERRMSKMLVDKSVPPTVKKMHSKSIRAERINFIKSFDQNLYRIQNKNDKKLTKVNKHHVFYSKVNSMTNTTTNSDHKEVDDFFRLTKTSFERETAKKIKVVLSNSIDHIKEQETILVQTQSDKLANFTRESSVGRYPSLLETNFINYLPNKFILTCIVTQTLQSIRLKLMVRNGTIIQEDSRQAINLPHIFQQILANNSMLHLIFHSDGALIYQKFIVSDSYKSSQNKQHQITLLMYYLKRFLLFDHKSTLKSVRESADLLLKGNIDLPDEFVDFIEAFPEKMCRVYDKDQRLYQFGMKLALTNALASVSAFKKEMGFGKKVVKLKHGTREQFKKYMYNWEYFYICLSNISHYCNQLNFDQDNRQNPQFQRLKSIFFIEFILFLSKYINITKKMYPYAFYFNYYPKINKYKIKINQTLPIFY